MNKLKTIVASAPGSMMITGEHAVVYGYSAIVAAINQRIDVRLLPRNDQQLIIKSALSDYQSSILDIQDDPLLRFVLSCVRQFTWEQGLEIHIESMINHQWGLGSSAAVTVSTLAAINRLKNSPLSARKLHEQALSVIHQVQKRGSGADIAASIWGGMIAYTPDPFCIKKLPNPELEIHLSYAGYKTPTAEVLSKVSAQMAENPQYYAEIYQSMGKVVDATIAAASASDWQAFYKALNQYQRLMEKLGVSDAKLDAMMKHAKEQKGVKATKISGSGLGDCIITFAERTPVEYQKMPIDIQGMRVNAVS